MKAPWVVLVCVAGCMAPSVPPVSTAPHAGPTGFLVFGDAGTGGPSQFVVAKAMEGVCQARGCRFALEVGDNLYESGASSPYDPQFEAKFERPYANLSFPIWVVLGNHDNAGNPAGSDGGLGAWYPAGDNEVAYGVRTNRTSDRWHMPARFYGFQVGDIAFFALDTNTLVYEDVPLPPDAQAHVRAQSAWLDGALQNATGARWKIALGHHPYLSNGPHGNAGAYDGHPGVPALSGDYLKGFFEAHLCGKVQLYLSGHDHDLEWLSAVPSCGSTQFIVSGGGGASTYNLTGSDPVRFQEQTLGFWWLQEGPNGLLAVAYDAGGHPLFSGTLASA
ncbi:MAG: metallophosphoesterase [Thermoplasmatota archaeon]